MTRIKRLEIENFKCFQQRTAFDFGKITLLTGANSSGKSSVMYAILGALQSGEFPFVFSTNGHFVEMGDFRDVVFGHDVTKRISITLQLEGGAVDFGCTTFWSINPENQLPVLDELIFFEKGHEYLGKVVSPSILDQEKELKPSPFKVVEFQIPDSEGNFLRTRFSFSGDQHEMLQRLRQFAIEFAKRSNSLSVEQATRLEKFEYQFEEVEVDSNEGGLMFMINLMRTQFLVAFIKINFIGSFRLPPFRTYLEQNRTNRNINHLGEGYLEQIIQWELRDKAKYAQLVQTMKDLELLNSIRTKRMEGGRYEMAVRVKEDGVETSLTDIGFGVSQFLPIIVADLQLPNGSTLFVSQPETHLHPSVQSSFGDYLVRQVKTLDKNYIIETHSEYLLNRIRLAIVKGEIKEEDVSVYYLEPHPDGNISHRVTFDRQGRILGAPEDFFKTYMMDVMEIAMQAE